MGDFDRRRAERDFDMNPPANAPGQGDDWDNLFSDGNQSPDVNNFMGTDADINGILNGTQSNMGSLGNGNLMQGQGDSFGSKIGSALDSATVAGAKGVVSYLKVVVGSLKNNKSRDWNILGTRACKISVGVFIFGIVCTVASKTFIPSIKDGIDLAVGSCLSLIVGLILVGFNKRNAEEEISSESMDVNDSYDDMDSDDFEDEIEESPYSDEEDDDDAEDYSSLFSDSSDSVVPDSSFFASNDSFDVSTAVNDLPEIPKGQYTRQFLFETFSKVLPILQPSFMDMEEVPDTTDEFMMFDDYLRRSAEQTGLKEDKLDELQLLEVRKNLFIIQLLATRPTGLKEKDIADGVADCYKRDDYGTTINGREGVFARVNSQVGRLIIDIFLCNSVMVSLGDVYRKKSDFILNTDNIMPLIWGISEMGNVFCYDGMKDGNGGIIISGEARSGKSWKGQSLIAQMCMFMSPKELNLYFYDVKGQSSDYAYLSSVLPHCKGFCGDALKFNESISSLLDRESTRRTNMLAGKYTNVKDYNKDHPYDKIPTIYIVIDEMATAMSEMKDKDIEIRKRFDSLLIQIATKYPYLEIKLLLFPHRIVNDIINKTVSSMISTRSVMGNVPADDLKTALDIKKDFPYSLVKTGDMAIKTKSLNNGNAVYSHSEVLSTSEQVNRKIFDYIGEVWRRIEPDCEQKTSSSVISSLGDEEVDVGSSTRRGEVKAKDNSAFDDDYHISMDRSSNVSSNVEDGVDESFWESILEESTNNSSDESYWNSFKHGV